MNAIKPNFFHNVPTLIEERQEAEPTLDEKSLYTMSKSRGWKIFSDMANDVIAELNNVNNVAIQNGASFEELGRNAVVVSLAQEAVRKLLNKVSDAVEACEPNE